MKNLRNVSVLLGITLSIGIIAAFFIFLSGENKVTEIYAATVKFYSYLALLTTLLLGTGLFLVGTFRHDKTIKLLASIYLVMGLVLGLSFIIINSSNSILFNIGYIGTKLLYLPFLILLIIIVVKLIQKGYLHKGLGALVIIATVLGLFGLSMSIYTNFVFVYLFYKESKLGLVGN